MSSTVNKMAAVQASKSDVNYEITIDRSDDAGFRITGVV